MQKLLASLPKPPKVEKASGVNQKIRIAMIPIFTSLCWQKQEVTIVALSLQWVVVYLLALAVGSCADPEVLWCTIV